MFLFLKFQGRKLKIKVNHTKKEKRPLNNVKLTLKSGTNTIKKGTESEKSKE